MWVQSRLQLVTVNALEALLVQPFVSIVALSAGERTEPDLAHETYDEQSIMRAAYNFN